MVEIEPTYTSPFILWLWLLISIPPLLLVRRWISRHTQIILLLLTRHDQMAMLLNQIVFLPGVILHEVSHWLMARMVGARTISLSIWPARQADGSLRLGYVQTERVDFVREAMIGIAPLLAGSAAVVMIGYSRLAVGSLETALASGNVYQFFQFFTGQVNTADLLIWLYLLFALSNTMLPSASDWRAWPAVLLLLGALGLVLYVAGAEQFVQHTFGSLLATGVRVIASAFTITTVIDLLIAPIVFGVECVLWQVSTKQVSGA